MSSYNRNIRMTTLVEVTSTGSGGRAKVIAGHPVVIAGDHITNRSFSRMQVGDRAIVRLSWNPTKRRTISIFEVRTGEPTWSKEGFMDAFRVDLENEAKTYAHVYGSEFKAAVAAATPTRTVLKSEPGWLDGFWLSNDDMQAFTAASVLAKSDEGMPSKVLMVGPSGYGKTTSPQAFAGANDYGYARFNVALVRDPEEFLGYRTVEDGDVIFEKSEFTKAIEKGNMVVVLDELNRASPEMANAIFPLLDDSAETWVFGNHIKVGENTIIVATVNLGYQFTGTFSLDQALVNRFDITVQVGPLPTSVEIKVVMNRTNVVQADAEKIVRVAAGLRSLNDSGRISVDASTRTTIKVGRLVNAGLSVKDAYKLAVMNGASIDERKDVIDAISSAL